MELTCNELHGTCCLALKEEAPQRQENVSPWHGRQNPGRRDGALGQGYTHDHATGYVPRQVRGGVNIKRGINVDLNEVSAFL